MDRNKQLVDKHVSNLLGRIKDEKERNSRGFQIAKLYYEVGEYEIAKRYLAGFLVVKPKIPQAHKLMGQINEAQKQSEKAIECYKVSLQLEDNQKDVVCRICDLYSNLDVDPDRAKFWYEKGEKLKVDPKVLSKLQDKMYDIRRSSGSEGSGDLEAQLTADLASRPKDVKARIRLLKFYTEKHRINEAFSHAVEVEKKNPYGDSLEWYQCLGEVFRAYQKDSGNINGAFHRQLLTVTNSLVALSLEKGRAVDAVQAVFHFDQGLFSAVQQSGQTEEWKAFISEMQAQFFFHVGTLVLKRAQNSQMTWTDANNWSSACYLCSHSINTVNVRQNWMVKAKEEDRWIYKRLVEASKYRLFQVGNMLTYLCSGDKQVWKESVKQKFCSEVSKKALFDALFTQRDMRSQTALQSSYLLSNNVYTSFKAVYPNLARLKQYAEDIRDIKVEKLNELVWAALQSYTVKDYTQPDYGFKVFTELQYSVNNLESAAPESLCQIDCMAFLYTAVRTSALKQEIARQHSLPSSDKPEMLPACLSQDLCSQDLSDWWAAAYKLFTNTAREQLGSMRLTLQRGLEVIRMIHDKHGLDTTMVVHLAKTFEERAEEASAKGQDTVDFANEVHHLQARAVHYWEKAVEMLGKLKRNRSVGKPAKLLFESVEGDVSEDDIANMLQDGIYFLAHYNKEHERYEEALRGFEEVDTADASFQQAMIYKQLAEEELNRNPQPLMDDARAAYEEILTKAKDALYKTLDRIGSQRYHRLSAQLPEEIDDIECKLSRLESESVAGNSDSSILGTPLMRSKMDRNESAFSSTPHRYQFNKGSYSSPRVQHHSPSPERISAEIRAMTNMHKSIDEILSALRDDMKENRKAVRELQSKFEDFERCQKVKAEDLERQQMLKYEEFERKRLQQVEEFERKKLQQEEDYQRRQLRRTEELEKQLQEKVEEMTRKLQQTAEDFERKQRDEFEKLQKERANKLAQQPPVAPPQPVPPAHFPTPRAPPHLAYPHLGYPGYGLPDDYSLHQAMLFSQPLVAQQASVLQNNTYPGTGSTTLKMRGTAAEHENDYEEEYSLHDDEEEGTDGHAMSQDWPHGNSVEGKTALAYSSSQLPPRAPVPVQQPPRYFPQPGMPGPGQDFFTNLPRQYGSNVTLGQMHLNAQAAAGSPLSFGQPPPVSLTTNKPTGTASSPSIGLSPQPGLNQASATSKSLTGIPLATSGTWNNAVATGAFFSLSSSLSPGVGTTITTAAPSPSIQTGIPVSTPSGMVSKPPMKDTKPTETPKDTAEKQTPKVIGTTDGQTPTFSFTANQKGNVFGTSTTTKASTTTVPLFGTPTANANTTVQSTFSFGGTNTSSASSMLKSMAASAGKDAQPQTTQGNTVGGFSFSSMPVIKNVEDAKATTPKTAAPTPTLATNSAATKPPNPFQNFTFNTSPKSSTTGSTTATFGSVSSMGNVSFESLLKGAPSQGFKPTSPGSGFTGVGSKVFGKSPEKAGDNEDEVDPEYEPNVDFKPIVPLPDLVEVKTGEEEEEKLFGERAKLFRHNPETKEWKERGIGEMKVLYSKDTNKYRILMRREQVLKLCANHVISKDMKLNPMASSDKAWCWFAPDYSEEEVKTEQFAVKFKTPELAQKFKEVFDDAVEKTKTQKTPPKAAPKAAPVVPKGQSIAEKFKMKEGEWECTGCLVRNKPEMEKCPACATPRPGTKPKAAPEVSSTTATPQAKGATQSISALFKPKAGEWECEMCLVKNNASSFKCVACNTPKPGATPDQVSSSTNSEKSGALSFGSKGGFTFSAGATSTPAGSSGGFSIPTVTSSTQPSANQGFVFGGTTGLPSFSKVQFGDVDSSSKDTPQKTQPPSSSATPSSGGFQFGSSTIGSTSFSFSGVNTPKSPGEPEYYENSEEEDNIHFEPIVPLPDKVETKTGEEEETVLFTHRAKLYRFVDGQWKERGIGDIKILEHKVSKRKRMVMRREQVLKICLNHYVTKELELKAMPGGKGNSWIWHADDFSEDELKHEQFAIKFKDESIAKDFKQAFDKARGAESDQPAEGSAAPKETKQESKPVISSTKGQGETPKTSSNLESFSFKIDANKKDNIFQSGGASSSFKFTPSSTTQSSSGFSFQTPTSDTTSKLPQFAFGTASAFSKSEPALAGRKSGESPLSSSNKGKSMLVSLLEQKDEVSIKQEPGADDDVIFVSEKKPTADQLSRARALMLPDSFYFYEEKEDCPGCIGCTDGDWDAIKDKVMSQKGQGRQVETQKAQSTKAEADSTQSSGSGVFGSGSGFSFAAVAATNKTFSGQSASSEPFSFKGAGATIFGGNAKASAGGEENSDDDDNVEDGPDVHFEPVVPLPELVEVKTGEEDEEVLFSHRSKIFVYDSKSSQWKERGIGDVKILKNKDTSKCRVLQRREQVLKLSCNHAITLEMKLKPLNTAENAWCWGALDFADGEPKQQQFAVRFKLKETAEKFRTVFEDYQKRLAASPEQGIDLSGKSSTTSTGVSSSSSQVSSSTDQTSTGTTSVSSSSSATKTQSSDQSSSVRDAEDPTEEEYETEEEEEDEDIKIIFTKRATMFYGEGDNFEKKGLGDLLVIHDDDDLNVYRIEMSTDKGEKLCSHIICRENRLHVNDKKKSAEWKAKDFSTDEAIKRYFKVEFSSKGAVEEFQKTFDKGIGLARESEVSEASDHPIFM